MRLHGRCAPYIMRITLLILLLVLIVLGCKLSPTKSDNKPEQNKISKINNIKTLADIDSSLKNVSYVAENGIIYDTIYHDSLIEKALIVNTEIIDNTFYLSYSKYSVEKEMKYDLSFYYDGHFINSYDSVNLPAKKWELFDYNKLTSVDSEIFIGHSCTNNDNLDFERFNDFPDSDSIIYIHAKMSDCDMRINHIFLKKVEHHFEKLFEIISTESNPKFEIKDDSIIYSKYKLLTEDTLYINEFKYDFKNHCIIE